MNAIDRLSQAAYEMHRALLVIAKDPNIYSILSNLDPQALKQCEEAILVYTKRHDKEWMVERYGL